MPADTCVRAFLNGLHVDIPLAALDFAARGGGGASSSSPEEEGAAPPPRPCFLFSCSGPFENPSPGGRGSSSGGTNNHDRGEGKGAVSSDPAAIVLTQHVVPAGHWRALCSLLAPLRGKAVQA